MQAFEYASPKTTGEVVKLLANEWGQTEVLAGGTDLLDRMKDHVSTPQRVVSLKLAAELRGVQYKPSDGLRLGAMVTLDELAENSQVRRHYPGLAQAAEIIGGPQLRNMGTVGGNLCQRPRCWYYRAGYGLLATENGKSLVPDGDNRYHAILGNAGPAYFVSPSSLAPILIALGAKVRLSGPQGSRDLALDQFFVTPKSDGEREHSLKPNEIVIDVLVPAPDGARSAVEEVRHKEAMDWPLALAAVVLRLDGKTVKSARVVLGHVAPVPWPAPEAEQALAGKAITEAVADKAGKAAVSKATPLSKNAHKVQLARVAVKRAILHAAQGGA